MTGCSSGRCGTRIGQPRPAQAPPHSMGSGEPAKGLKGTLYYPTLEIKLITKAGIPVEGHVQMKTGLWGILSSADGDTTRLLDPIPQANIGLFAAPMRRGIVKIEITHAKCAKGYFLINKMVRRIHYKKETIEINWNPDEIRYE